MFSDISGRVVSTFENPNVLAEYLIMILPIAAAGFLTSKDTSQKLSFLMIGSILGALTYVALYMLKTFIAGQFIDGLTMDAVCWLARLQTYATSW